MQITQLGQSLFRQDHSSWELQWNARSEPMRVSGSRTLMQQLCTKCDCKLKKKKQGTHQ